MTNARGEFMQVPASMAHRARRVRPEEDPRLTALIGLRDRGNPWRRVQFQNRQGHSNGVWFVPHDGEAVRIDGVRATHAGRPGFATPVSLSGRPLRGETREVLPGLLYRFRPDAGEPVVLYDFALEVRPDKEERDARRDFKRAERVRRLRKRY